MPAPTPPATRSRARPPIISAGKTPVPCCFLGLKRRSGRRRSLGSSSSRSTVGRLRGGVGETAALDGLGTAKRFWHFGHFTFLPAGKSSLRRSGAAHSGQATLMTPHGV